MNTFNIIHVPDRHVFECSVEGKTADIEYRPIHGGIHITHTFVPPELGGRGIAGELAKFVLAYAREQGWKIETSCSYFSMYLHKHPEYQDIYPLPEQPQSGA